MLPDFVADPGTAEAEDRGGALEIFGFLANAGSCGQILQAPLQVEALANVDDMGSKRGLLAVAALLRCEE